MDMQYVSTPTIAGATTTTVVNEPTPQCKAIPVVSFVWLVKLKFYIIVDGTM
jgi:hypothetical protein